MTPFRAITPGFAGRKIQAQLSIHQTVRVALQALNAEDFGLPLYLNNEPIKVVQQPNQTCGFHIPIELSDRLRPNHATFREITLLIQNGNHARYEDKLQPLGEGHRVHGEGLLEVKSLLRQILFTPIAKMFHFSFDFSEDDLHTLISIG